MIKYKVGEQVYPICWETDPSNQCQLNCDYCCWATLRTERGDVMSGKRLTRLIHEISELDGKSIIWSGGGDPLTNPKTADAIELAHRMEIDNGMFTNGLGDE